MGSLSPLLLVFQNSTFNSASFTVIKKKDIKKLAKAEILSFLNLQGPFYIIETSVMVAHRILQLLLALERPQKHESL